MSTILNWFNSNTVFIEVEQALYADMVKDSKDASFYAAAKCTKAKLVTGNVKHYPVEEMITVLWEMP